MEKKKTSFFKKVKTSVFDFDGYQDLAAEKLNRTIGYIAILMLVFSIIVSAIYTFQIYSMINNIKNYINNEIAEVNYENYEINIIPNNGEEITRISVNNMISTEIIINTQTDDEEIIQETINEINNTSNGILILKDRVLIKNSFSDNLTEYEYKTIAETYNINNIDKNELINILSSKEIYIALAIFFTKAILYMFIIYMATILIDILLLALLTYIVTRIAGLRLKHSAVYNIAAYSLTLPVILNIIYFIVRSFTGFTIEYFQVMYTAIASIYIITAILMIKSDVIKRQLELNRIIEEQERVKQEFKRQEEEKKEQEEQERRRQEREKKKEEKKEKEKNKEEGNINNEPEGDNA